jgi:WD40 repeat protein
VSTRGPIESLWSVDVEDFPTAIGWSGEGEVTVLDGATGEEVARLAGHDGGLMALHWHPKQRKLATAGGDGTVRVWRMDKPDEPQELVTNGSWVEHLAWSPDGKLLATSAGQTVQLWKGSKLDRTSPKLGSTCSALVWSSKGKAVFAGAFGGIRRIDAKKGTINQTLRWEGSPICLAITPDDSVIAAGLQDRTLHFWRLKSAKDSEMRGFPFKAKVVDFSHDGRWLAQTGAEQVLVWPFHDGGPEGAMPLQLEGHPKALTQVAFAPLVPVLASACKDGLVLFWMVGRAEDPVAALRIAESESVEALAWAPPQRDGGLRAVAAGKRGTVQAVAMLRS